MLHLGHPILQHIPLLTTPHLVNPVSTEASFFFRSPYFGLLSLNG